MERQEVECSCSAVQRRVGSPSSFSLRRESEEAGPRARRFLFSDSFSYAPGGLDDEALSFLDFIVVSKPG